MSLRVTADLALNILEVGKKYKTSNLRIILCCSKNTIKKLAIGGWLEQGGNHDKRYYKVIK